MLNNLIWPIEQIEHIARHGVKPEEVEEVCFGREHAIFRAKSQGSNPVYYIFGRTSAGKLLFCVIIQFPDGNGYPVTARPMTEREKQRFKKWRS